MSRSEFVLLKDLVYFVKEREAIRIRKEDKDLPQPWTKDPILAEYRFCNIFRENDAVTRWVHKEWLKPHANDRYLWFAAYVARVFNLPNTLHGITLGVFNKEKVKWDRDRAEDILISLAATGHNIFNAAYIVSTNGARMDKVQYYLAVFDKLWKDRDQCVQVPLESLALWLQQYKGIGSFMAGQVVADVKHFGAWCNAPDWYTFAVSGPGSRRGMNRLLGLAAKAPYGGEAQWLSNLLAVRAILNKRCGLPRELDAQNSQSVLCEVDKYWRAKSGEGRPKQKYRWE